ncbi:arginyl-tRNA synthetase [Stipitochalara longipes BDJ]|nr:arginyl-tRNA synthetase [Stipitochalara longipes BDJ]
MATTSLPGLEAFLAEIGLGPVPSFEAADVLHNPLDLYRSYLAADFHQLVDSDPDLVYKAIQPPNTIQDGDLDIVLPRLKLSGSSPKELAGELLRQIQPHILFGFPFQDGIHIRFFFSPKIIPRLLLPYINDRKPSYGIDNTLGLRDGPDSGRKKVLVEFSSPNIAQDFTSAHLRSTILGAFVANLYETMGWDVVRINYLGDWGKHLGLLGLGWQKYGSAEKAGDRKNLFKYIHNLYNKMEDELRPELEARKNARDAGQDATILDTQGLFAERDATFKRMEDGEEEAIALWKKLRDITVEYYVETYERLNISFDEYSGESEVSMNQEAVAEVETILKSKGIYEEHDGAWVIDYDKHGAKLGTATVRGRNGSTTYLLRDIATVFDRFKRHSFDKMIYVVCEQDVHFRQVIKTVELMGHPEIANKLEHITFSKANRRSSHLGDAQLLGDILDGREDFMREVIGASPEEYHIEGGDDVAKAMGLSSLVVQELRSKKGHSNNPDLSLLAVEGETGPDLLRCYARLCSAIAATGVRLPPEEFPNVDYSPLWTSPWFDLLRLMARYPGIIKSAFNTVDPTTILAYIFQIVEEVTYCLDEAEEDESGGEGSNVSSKYAARAVMYESARQILESGMKVLGITPVFK